jgi:hypothetical protein
LVASAGEGVDRPQQGLLGDGRVFVLLEGQTGHEEEISYDLTGVKEMEKVLGK